MLAAQLERTRNAKRREELEQELLVPPFPMPVIHVYRAFRRLRSRRGGDGFAISPITWPDIDAFVRNSHVCLAPWEIEMIEDLDDIYRSAMSPPSD